jgi:hypothetical protein
MFSVEIGVGFVVSRAHLLSQQAASENRRRVALRNAALDYRNNRIQAVITAQMSARGGDAAVESKPSSRVVEQCLSGCGRSKPAYLETLPILNVLDSGDGGSIAPKIGPDPGTAFLPRCEEENVRI